MSSDWRATPSSYGLLRSRGRKVLLCLLPAGNLLLPSLCLLSVFHLPLCQSLSPQTSCGAAERRRSSAAASERSWSFAGRARNGCKRWSWQGVRVKQVKGCSHLKKKERTGGEQEWEKWWREWVYQGWLGRWYSQVYCSALELYCLMVRLPIRDFLRAVWRSQLKIARFLFSQDWLHFLNPPLLRILNLLSKDTGLGTTRWPGIFLLLSLMVFLQMYI